ncbi:HNH endonuclease signature motif containing protein [Actinotalea sp. Marseille-Q4924]|uniref:HNH endonuclease signature motif containing protein n=1 Tax=Actinotalea sp. Marseille-Q4924 TaxID=2866571 RepID=UPI001CE42C33|nr:HNH endonuclease signature motif containing protein [Actinotalea sp. Marseille-Q4924]
MFDSGGRGRRAAHDGGVPEWAFSGSVRLAAAADRSGAAEVGRVGRDLAGLRGGPLLVRALADLLGVVPTRSGSSSRSTERAATDGTIGGAAGPDREAMGSRTRRGEADRLDEAAWLDEADRLDEAVRLGEPDWTRLDEVDAGSLVEVVAAFERVASWARAGAARAAALLTERPEVRPQWPAAAGVVAEQCTASTDLSLRLGVTRHAARTLYEVGRALSGPLQDTGAALEAGDIDWEKACSLAELLRDAPLPVAVDVQAAVLPLAGALTRPQLARAAQRALQRADHRDAAERHARARARRRVGRPRVLPDGMAAMTAILPAEAAVRLDACLQAAAVSARRDGDGRTTDQLRADALDTLARAAWGAGWIGAPPLSDVPATEAPPTDVPEARAGATAGAHRSAIPWSGGVGAPMRLAQNAGRGTLISVTVGFGTLLGLDDRPGELAGYGPIGADVARMLATEGTWRRLVVDEPTGALLDVDRRRYRPPAGIVDHVRLRNRTCVFPTCSVPAASCQIDHTVPFPHGPTAADNLGPLCTSHHQMKTHAGYHLEQPRPGSFVVRTAMGHVYLQEPERQVGVPAPDDASPCWDDDPTGDEGGEPPF